MADEGAIEQPFFIYDHNVLKNEEDDIKDAIIYFYPPMTSIDDRCALCGQLMGMVTFFISLAGAPPSIYRLQKSKVAVHHQGRFTLALGGDQRLPDKVLLNQLDFGVKLFTFFHRNFNDVVKLCERQGRNFVNYLGIIWDTYIPFTRYYGDDFLSSMRPVPTLELSRGQSSLFLRASNLLETCQRAPGVLAGCLLVRNRVLSTQLTPEFTSRLLLIRPHQTHLPCRAINSDFSLPVGVRLLAVYITEDEETLLYPPWCELETEETEYPSLSTEDSCASTETSHIDHNLASDEVKESEEDTLSFVSLDGKTPRSSPEPSQRDRVQTSVEEPIITESGDGSSTLAVKQMQEPGGSQAGHEHRSSQNQSPDKELSQTIGEELKDSAYSTYNGNTESKDRSGSGVDINDVHSQAERITQTVLEAACAVVYGNTGRISQTSEIKEQDIIPSTNGDVNENGASLDAQATSEELREARDLDKTGSGSTTPEELAAQLVQKVIAAAKAKMLDSYKGNDNEKEPGYDMKGKAGKPPEGCRFQDSQEGAQGSASIEAVADELSLSVMYGAMGFMESTKCTYQEGTSHISGTELSSVQLLADDMTQAAVDSAVSHVNGTEILAGEITQAAVDSALKPISHTVDDLTEKEFSACNKKPTEQEDTISLRKMVTFDNVADNMTDQIVEDVMRKFSPAGSIDIEIKKPKIKKDITNLDKSPNGRKNLTLDLSATRTSLKPSSPIPPYKDPIPFTPLTAATKTELFKAVKQASKIAVQNYEALTSGETTPELPTNQGATRSTSRAGSDAGSRESDSHKLKNLSIDTTMKRLVSLTKPAAEQAAAKQTTHSKESSSSPDQRSWASSDTSSATDNKESPTKDVQEKKPKRTRKRLRRASDGLCEVDLYVQGNNDLLLMLVMEGGTSQEKDTVNKLWKLALPQLGDMDVYIKERHIGRDKETRKEVEYNYLLYNSSQQTLKGNKMQPVTGAENKFCQTTVTMHDEFCNSETLTDIMLRSHNSYVYGHRSVGQETFFQMHGSARSMAGFPNERELKMSADAVAYQKMLTEERALII